MIKLEKKDFPLKWEDICEMLNVDESLDEICVNLATEKKVKAKKEKPDYNKNFIKVAEIVKGLENEDIEFPIELYRFGTYTQYESAGEEVNRWGEISFLSDNDFDNDVETEIDSILSFLDKEYIKSLGCEMYGQNVLLLNEDGSTEFDGFRI